MKLKGLKALVKGRVQGVFFRSNTREKALKLSLTGWVRNESSGDVLVMAEGEESNLFEFIEWLKIGPELAKVTDLNFEWLDSTEEFTGFDIRY